MFKNTFHSKNTCKFWLLKQLIFVAFTIFSQDAIHYVTFSQNCHNKTESLYITVKSIWDLRVRENKAAAK